VSTVSGISYRYRSDGQIEGIDDFEEDENGVRETTERVAYE